MSTVSLLANISRNNLVQPWSLAVPVSRSWRVLNAAKGTEGLRIIYQYRDCFTAVMTGGWGAQRPSDAPSTSTRWGWVDWWTSHQIWREAKWMISRFSFEACGSGSHSDISHLQYWPYSSLQELLVRWDMLARRTQDSHTHHTQEGSDCFLISLWWKFRKTTDLHWDTNIEKCWCLYGILLCLFFKYRLKYLTEKFLDKVDDGEQTSQCKTDPKDDT